MWHVSAGRGGRRRRRGDVRGVQPLHRRGDRHRSREGSREDAQRAIEAANAASPAWARCLAFDRAGRDAPNRRGGRRPAATTWRARCSPSTRASRGRPRHSDEVAELPRLLRHGGGRRGAAEGALPPSLDANKRVLAQRVPRGVIAVISPWDWPYTMPGEILAPAIAYGNAVVWRRRRPRRSARSRSPSASRRLPPARPVEPRDRTWPGRRRRDRANPGTQAVGFIGSIATGCRWRRARPARSSSSRWAGTARWSFSRTPTLTRRWRATLVACFLNAGQSCTAGERILVHRDVRDAYLGELSRRDRGASSAWATRSTTRRRWAR